jgi:Xaa-Pro aminopeptidase
MNDVFDVIAPGVASSELRHAAERGASERRPWFENYYLVHGLGTQGSELPYVGTDLGVTYEESLVLQPGMVMVLEPVIWEDGRGGFRAEEIVVVTDDGFEMLSHFPHPAFAEEESRW